MSSDPDTLHVPSAPGATWSTTNLSESIPGVPTPLGWSIWYPAGELAVRRTFHEIGALSQHEAVFPDDPDERLMGIFFGRAALRVDLICDWVERVPGSDSAATAQAAFSAVPENYTSRNQPQYFPRVLARGAVPFVKAPKLIRAQAPVTAALRTQALKALPTASETAARRWLEHGVEHWMEGLFRNTLVTMGAVQPAIDLLERLTPDARELMAGYGGHEETRVVGDAWATSRGRLSFDAFIARHGYHGWHEGEISAEVWRENPEPARAFIQRYGERGEDQDPAVTERERVHRRRELEAQFLAGLPAVKRPLGRLALKLAATYIPLRGAGKVTFLQGLDVARAAARRLGDDAFYLTLDEIRTGAAADTDARREARERYQQLEIPEAFRGTPEPRTLADHEGDVIEGTAASPGVVTGPVRVIHDPDDADIEDGEILVGRTTDPSWASLMFLSAGLIADIGGTLSHTAVVARELGLPCVVNTKVATRALHTGDIVRLDGSSGTIEILERAV